MERREAVQSLGKRFNSGIPAPTRAITEWLNTKKRERVANVPELATQEMMIIEKTETSSAINELFSKSSTSRTNEVITLDDSDEEQPTVTEKESGSTEWIVVDGQKFSKEAFSQLPLLIRKQYEHRMTLESARLLKKTSKNTTKKNRKRGANLNVENQKKKQKTVSQLHSFFTKCT
ncbi:unnamed protein product [Caenorhabditis sp. 36 PRJEB53466]|nr:unnamed protein product [Caenorhabditis sp. 36 PRJEB53466]